MCDGSLKKAPLRAASMGIFMSLRTSTNLLGLRFFSYSGVLVLSVVALASSGCSTVGKDKTGSGINEKEEPGAADDSKGQGSTSGSSSATLTGSGGTTTPGVSSTSPDSSQEEDKSSSSDESSSSLGEITDTPDESAHLQYLVVAPGNKILELDLQTSREVPYRAIGFFSDGKRKDMSGEVTWSISSAQIGSFKGKTLVLSPQSKLFVETAVVTAKVDSIEARAQLTVAASEQDGPRRDFVFVLPYQSKAGSNIKSLKFKTKVQALDVFFSVDTTASMKDEIAELSRSLRTTIVPELRKEIPSTHFGVGAVEDFPFGGHGHPKGATPSARRHDQPFRLAQPITQSVSDVQSAVARLDTGMGADLPEAILEALYQIATGKGLNGPGVTKVASYNKGIGGVGFRKGTMPVVVSITDAASHAPGETLDGCGRDYHPEVKAVAATRAQTEEALEKICARVITVASEGNLDVNEACSPRIDGKKLADATKARVSPLVWDGKRPAGCVEGECCTGLNGVGVAPGSDGLCDLVFDVNSQGAGLDKSIVLGVQALAFFAPFDVVSEKEGEPTSVDGKPLPNGRTTLDFFRQVVAKSHGPLPIPGLPKPQPSGESFKKVTPGTEITFALHAYNNFLKPTTKAQVFRAKVGVKADQCDGLALDKREVVFVVPPKPLVEG